MIENKYYPIIQATLNEANEVRAKVNTWKELKKAKYLTIYSSPYKDNSLKMTKIEGTVPANIDKVSQYYFSNLDAQQKNREEMVSTLKVIENLDQNTSITFSKTKSKFLVSSRETLNVTNRIQISPTEVVIVKGHLDSHPNVIISKDSVQTQTKLFALYLTKIDQNYTKIEAFILVDPKGSIPSSITNTMSDLQLKAYEKDIEVIVKP